MSKARNIAKHLRVIFTLRKDLIGRRTLFQINTFKRGTAVKCASGDLLQRKRNIDAFQLITAVKCLIADDLQAVRQLDISQSHATVEGARANLPK